MELSKKDLEDQIPYQEVKGYDFSPQNLES